MRLRFVLLMVCLMFAVSSAWAQGFTVWFYDESFPLNNACTAGTPLPDGTIITIYQDFTANGPDATDDPPSEGGGNNQVNFTQFPINGQAELQTAGCFAGAQLFTMESGFPNPGEGSGHPLYYLKVCLDALNTIWISDTFRVVSGYQEVYFGDGVGLVPFECENGVCGGCPTPVSVTNLIASTTYCDSVLISWQHTGLNVAGYRVALLDSFPVVYRYISGAANTADTLRNQLGGTDIHLRVRAYNICAPDTVYSAGVEVIGRAVVGPPTPTEMTASDDSCGTVRLQWSINTVLGLDEFRIWRNGAFLGTAPRGTAGSDHEFVDNAPLPGVANYCVYGYSAVCSTGTGACDNGQAGAIPTCTVTNVVASDDDCDEVCVTWTANCTDADSFIIRRNTIAIDTVTAAGGPNYSFCHAPSAGLLGAYQIVPMNACGAGTPFPGPPGEPGVRLGPPVAVTGIAASDTLCDRVHVSWTAVANIDSFQIRLNGNRIGVATGAATAYDDLTAVAGVTSTYTVVAYNECGPGAVATGNGGTRRAAGTGTATFTLVTAGPPNWTYSMDVNTGCLDKVKIRDYCAGTTATAPNGWTVTVFGTDSIVFSTTTPVGALDPVVTGFGLSHPTCDGDGRWNIGDSGGSIRGPLPVGENAALPTEYSVKVYPNPFNPMTNFKIAIPQASDTRILVFNVTGQLVSDMNMGRMQAGYHTVQFGGSDLPSGMYFAKVLSGNFHSTHKLMLLK